jgi:16S rRNA (guanine(1405)-N(7))-methyltransferase
MKSDKLSTVNEQLDQLVEAVQKSAKYRNVCEDLIRDIGYRELSKQRNFKMATKSTKNKLHQIGGAYFLGKPNYSLWLEKLKQAKRSKNEDVFQKTCAEIMEYHHSTRERLAILDQFYSRIFSLLPPIHSIVDVACGFHPISVPWMPLSGRVRYYAYDVYKDMIDFLKGFFTVIGNVKGFAEVRDVILHPPKINADLCFILNAIPCLEQIEKLAGLRILESIKTDSLVVSFPTQTLGGREKDMRKYYEAKFNDLTSEKDWKIHRLEFSSELIFLIRKPRF